ncbi:MAG: serine/threonine protein kinase [Kiritimatiellaeota bacterium]|nr:serine/threonine protein kinase [Kiritimatiellota bacterium]
MENLIHIDPVSFVTCAQCRAELDTEGLPTFSTIICPQCGVEAVVHGRLGNFILTRLLGSGGMGGVYEAHDSVLNRAVAIKVMNRRLGGDPQFVENFLREAQAAARINHPSVVQIYSSGQENGMPYIVMELVSGGSLDKLVAARGGRLDAALALRAGLEVAEGLKNAADSNLVHGDVKPENILIDEAGHAKLTDFGIASLSGNAPGEIWGTPYYIAPEKVRRQKTDFRSDIYSLGATLFHAVAGVPPFDGKDSTAVVKARLSQPAPPLASVAPDVDAEAAAVVDRMLQADPGQRYPTHESLIGDMRRYVEKAAARIPISKRVVLKSKSATGAQPATGPVTGNIAGLDESSAPRKKSIVYQKGAARAAAAEAKKREKEAAAVNAFNNL